MKKTSNKHITFFKIDFARKNRRATGELCRCGTPAVWCDGFDCPIEIDEMDVEAAAEQAEFTRMLDMAREFGY